MKRFLEIFVIVLAGGLAALLLAGHILPGYSQVVPTPPPSPLVDGLPAPSLDVPGPDQAGATSVLGPTAYLMVGSWEFMPTLSTLTYGVYGAAMYAVSIPGSGVSFKTPVHLPNGAQVTKVSFYIVDSSSTDNMTLQFYRTQPAVSTSQYEIGFVTTASLPTTAAVQTVSIIGAPVLTTIDNTQYAYCLRYAPVITGTAHMLVGARIDYSVPTYYLPLVMK